MESTAKARYVRIAPRKLRLVMDMVRGKPVEDALRTLGLVRKSASPVLAKVIKSALANAGNNHGMNTDSLFIKEAYVDEGPTLKRFMPRAMGRATAIRKRTSHITVVLSEK
ncbi:MAG: 50S ribosomal protein L22 [bacterium]|nr:50S ribosomal protein L22 [bacterium]MDT8395885.1 50S ribosomal protein L22 [bacterium]